MNDIDFVEDEFGNIGVRLNETLGAFLFRGLPIIADCKETKKKAALKSIPNAEQISKLKSMIPKRSMAQQFKDIAKQDKQYIALEKPAKETIDLSKIKASSKLQEEIDWTQI